MPKKSKKSKAPPILLVRPEPTSLDENEAAMSWDGIAALQPRPILPPAFYVAQAQIQIAMAQPPPGSDASKAQAAAATPSGKTASGGAASSSASAGANSAQTGAGGSNNATAATTTFSSQNPALVARQAFMEGLQTASAALPRGPPSRLVVNALSSTVPLLGPPQTSGYSAASAAAAFDSTQGFGPMPPPRHVLPSERTAERLKAEEAKLRESLAKLQDATHSQREYWLLSAKELFDAMMEHLELTAEISTLEHQLRADELAAHAELDEQRQRHDTEAFRLQQELDDLISRDDEMQELLEDERQTLAQKAQREQDLYTLQRSHQLQLKQLASQMKEDLKRSEKSMGQRLSRTTEEMAKVTATQHELRQKKAEEESTRLVTELSVLEVHSRHLTERSTALQKVGDAHRRDLDLEVHRRQILIDQHHELSTTVASLVAQLQGLEERVAKRQHEGHMSQHYFAQGSSNDHPPSSSRLDSDLIDSQYDQLAMLRNELEAVRSDMESIRSETHRSQQLLLHMLSARHMGVQVPAAITQHKRNGTPPPTTAPAGEAGPTQQQQQRQHDEESIAVPDPDEVTWSAGPSSHHQRPAAHGPKPPVQRKEPTSGGGRHHHLHAKQSTSQQLTRDARQLCFALDDETAAACCMVVQDALRDVATVFAKHKPDRLSASTTPSSYGGGGGGADDGSDDGEMFGATYPQQQQQGSVCPSHLSLKDPKERHHVQEYVVKRLNKALSSLYPTAPSFPFLKQATTGAP